MNLLIDIGNTRLKWCCSHNGQLSEITAFLNEELTEQQLIAVWQDLPTPMRIGLASVSKPSLQKLLHAVVDKLWPTLTIKAITSQAHAFGVLNAYKNPGSLGVDRWLAMVAARQCYPDSLCVVDCGTAITIDLLNAEGKHLGGMISPGLTTMKKSLAQGAAQLEFSVNQHAFGLANNTDAAIYSGTLASVIGLIEYVMKCHPYCQLLLTGGDGNLIASYLNTPSIVDNDLVMRGLSVVLQG
jgi:type III pantothenate kinase